MEIPVYLVNGFLESGKTSFVNETFSDPEFTNGEKTLLILCEEGIEEYDEKQLAAMNVDIVTVEEEEEFTEELLAQYQSFYRPQRVMIEWNGMWNVENFLELELPDNWEMVQIITTIDASTYNNYLNNMKSIMIGQFKYSDTIIFNRCDDSTDKIALRRSVKPVNRKGQIIYESENGVTDDAGEEVLPFDLNAEIIDLYDEDFGLFYMDALDNPKKYDGKTVRFRAMVYKSNQFPKGSFVPGRFAMTCCADDIAFIGFLCKAGKAGPLPFEFLKMRSWITVTAKIKCEYYKEYRGEGPILYAQRIEKAEEPKEKLVYFN
ncbi:TIGR03943 family putative permease subunit [Clostridium sp. Marseille-P299]|uniref:TIGR03943 family putative permease subunit n=1 Tax=Clostridium sp. Marseille-P299 TaxID=1805477 RepID=UPI00083325A1|nr:GTP-binding protein [Clostridium sp. Marseille-P299]